MSVDSTFTPRYCPKLHDLVHVHIPKLSNNGIPYRIVSVVGSIQQNKITALASQGSGKEFHNVHLIWKKGMDSWMVWFLGKQYRYVRVESAD